MLDAFLVPEKTIVTARGDGSALALRATGGRVFLLTLTITNIVEQESLDVSIHGSPDSEVWDPNSLLEFPQKFYRAEVPLLLDLSARPEAKFIRAHWEVGRWGRSSEPPMFEFQVALREVPAEILAEGAGRVRAS